jgi:hypothetical protein
VDFALGLVVAVGDSIGAVHTSVLLILEVTCDFGSADWVLGEGREKIWEQRQEVRL